MVNTDTRVNQFLSSSNRKMKKKPYVGRINGHERTKDHSPHFLRALAHGTAHQEGFRTYLIDELLWTYSERDFLQYISKNESEIEPNTIVSSGNVSHERRLTFSGYLHVRYENQAMLPEFYNTVQLNYNPSKEAIRSAIELLDINPVFNEIGFLNNSYDVGRFGYWGWEGGVCNLLPFDYTPHSSD